MRSRLLFIFPEMSRTNTGNQVEVQYNPQDLSVAYARVNQTWIPLQSRTELPINCSVYELRQTRKFAGTYFQEVGKMLSDESVEKPCNRRDIPAQGRELLRKIRSGEQYEKKKVEPAIEDHRTKNKITSFTDTHNEEKLKWLI